MEEIIKDHKYFDTQKDGEEVLIIARRHWIVYVPAIIIGLFVEILSVVVLFNIDKISIFDGYVVRGIVILTASFVMLFAALIVYVDWLIHYLNVQIVTNENIVDVGQSALFHRTISELTLNDIEDVTASQKGILQSLLQYGNVNIQTAGQLPNFVFEKVPEPYEISRRIMEIKSQYVGGSTED